jgi:hypothetical protein
MLRHQSFKTQLACGAKQFRPPALEWVDQDAFGPPRQQPLQVALTQLSRRPFPFWRARRRVTVRYCPYLRSGPSSGDDLGPRKCARLRARTQSSTLTYAHVLFPPTAQWRYLGWFGAASARNRSVWSTEAHIHPRHRAGFQARGELSMRTTLLCSMTFLAVFSFGAATAQAQNQACTDPPTSTLGKCLKRAGSTCDPATRRWIGGNDTAYVACISASGQTRTTTDAQGRAVTFKLTGRYSDCIRDSRKIGEFGGVSQAILR